MPEITLTLTGAQHRQLRAHLYPGDGNEAVVFALCGRRSGAWRHRMLVQTLHPIPYDQCTLRSPEAVAWSTDIIIPWLQKANEQGLSVVKIHSHPGGFSKFSDQDARSDGDLFPCVSGWIDAEVPHASAVMLPDGRMFGRAFVDGGTSAPLATIMVVGDDLDIWHADEFDALGPIRLPAFTRRHAQAFGDSTTRRLRRLSAAVIGCSGTGSVVIEQLMRLGIGRLILVDEDVIKDLNLNRILNATMKDAQERRHKVDMVGEAIEHIGLGTIVERYPFNLKDPRAVRAVAECDIIFGCVDTAEGRFIANLLASFYLLPYIDVGVALEADDDGAITQVCGYIHYLQPAASSLISRGSVDMEDVRAEGLKRQNPEFYETNRRAGYIRNVDEDRPAVISVNMMLAGMAVNEMLARIHLFRDEPNASYGTIGVSISQVQFYSERESGMPCRIIAPHAGRGDVEPLLEQPELSEATL